MKTLIQDTKDIIARLRGLSETKKKVIFFLVMGVCTVMMGFYALYSTKAKIVKFNATLSPIQSSDLQGPDFGTGAAK